MSLTENLNTQVILVYLLQDYQGPTAAMGAPKKAAEDALEKGINAIPVKVRTPGGHEGPNQPEHGTQAAVRALSRAGLRIGIIEDVTALPHGGCRKSHARRGRRV